MLLKFISFTDLMMILQFCSVKVSLTKLSLNLSNIKYKEKTRFIKIKIEEEDLKLKTFKCQHFWMLSFTVN